MADSIQELYKKYEILTDAKDKVSEHSTEFLDCISAIKGNTQEKKLAAQIIWKFFKHFPTLQEQALNALLDLCEDIDTEIVICAMKALPYLCKDNKIYCETIASILSQLLQLEDQGYTIACNSLTQVFKEDPLTATKGIISNIHATGGEDGLREKIIDFLYKKLVKVLSEKPQELEDLLMDQAKKILQDCTADEFMSLISYLLTSKQAKTPLGQQDLVNLVADKIEIAEKFNPLEETNTTDRLVICVECILPLFNATIDSSKFVVYYCTEILPNLSKIRKLEDGEGLLGRIFRQLAALSTHCGDIQNINDVVEQLFEALKEFMPLPPEDVDLSKVPNLEFTSVECLLYAFHRLARKFPEFLTNGPDRLKDFRSRLQYFSRGVQGCKRGLEKTLSSKNEEQHSEEDLQKIKLVPAVLDNINALIKDLFYQPPLYKCNIQLSFHKETNRIFVNQTNNNNNSSSSSRSQKRHVPITFDSTNGTNNNNHKQSRSMKAAGEDRKIYQPPTGKFSRGGRGGNTNRGTWNKTGGVRGQRGSRGGSRNWRN